MPAYHRQSPRQRIPEQEKPITGKIKSIDELYKGKKILDDFSSDIIDSIYKNDFLPLEECGFPEDPTPNQYFILKNPFKSILTYYQQKDKTIRMVEKKKAFSIQPRNAEQIFSLHALMNPDVQLVTLAGKAGTGKTLMALAAALEEAVFEGDAVFAVGLDRKDADPDEVLPGVLEECRVFQVADDVLVNAAGFFGGEEFGFHGLAVDVHGHLVDVRLARDGEEEGTLHA